MMRNTRLKVKPAGLFALVFAASVLLFTAGCHNPLLQDRQGDQATGTVLLTLGSGTAARTILPDAPVLAGIYKLRVVLQHTTNALYSYDEFWDTDRNIFMRELAVGTWDLDVYAYAEVEGLGPVVVAQGSRQVEVLEGRTTPAPIELSPVGDAGQGTFEWDITLPAGVTARMEIRNQDGGVVVPWAVLTLDSDNVASDSTLLASGTYLVIFELTKNGEILELTEVLHVYRHLTSLFSDEITEERFPQSLLAIMADAWDGSAFDGITINHNHFAALEIRGVTVANLEYLLESFGEFIGNAFPATADALAALVDAALIDVLGHDPTFTFAGTHAGQAAVETAIRDRVRDDWNDTYIDDFSWANAPVDWGNADDVLTVSIGGHEVEIMFTADQATVDTVTITPAGPIDFVVGVTPAVRLTAALATTPSGIIFPITWTSDDNNVIFVDADGAPINAPVTGTYVYVMGIDAASASIIATADGVASNSVVVEVTLPDAYSVTIGYDPAELYNFSEGGDMILTATVVSDPAGADFPVVWTVDAVHVRFLDGANHVATITTQPGYPHAVTIVGVSEGSATVTATVYGFAVDATLVVDVAETVVPPTAIPFTWNFQAAPAIPGWAQVAGANPDATATNAALNLTDADHVNNMRLLPSHTIGGPNPDGIAWAPAATRGSSNWNTADNTAFPTGAGTHVPGITDGRIQVNSLGSGETYFLSIADVPRPFTIAVDVASTGGPHPNRGATLLIDGVATGWYFATPAVGSGQATFRTTHTIVGTGTVDVQLGLRTDETIRIYRIHIDVAPPPSYIPEAALTLTGITAPVAGATPYTTVSGAPAGSTAGEVVWTNAAGAPAGPEFSTNMAYTATVTLTANPNYYFAVNFTGTINGQTATPTVAPNGATVTLSYTFPATADTAPDPEELEITGGASTVLEGSTTPAFNYTLGPSGASGVVVWDVAMDSAGTIPLDTSIATWDSANRTLTGVGAGTVFVIATVEGHPTVSAARGVTVRAPLVLIYGTAPTVSGEPVQRAGGGTNPAYATTLVQTISGGQTYIRVQATYAGQNTTTGQGWHQIFVQLSNDHTIGIVQRIDGTNHRLALGSGTRANMTGNADSAGVAIGGGNTGPFTPSTHQVFWSQTGHQAAINGLLGAGVYNFGVGQGDPLSSTTQAANVFTIEVDIDPVNGGAVFYFTVNGSAGVAGRTPLRGVLSSEVVPQGTYVQSFHVRAHTGSTGHLTAWAIYGQN